jgi:alpha-tubulin suppressor-like RCC1 family protein
VPGARCGCCTGADRCWGYDTYGQIRDGTTTQRTSPVATTGRTDGRGVATGGRGGDAHSCALRPGGVAVCWGANHYGQLGIGTISDAPTTAPVVVQAPAD